MPINVTVMLTGSEAVSWIRIGFNADPDLDQGFDVNADADKIQGGKSMRIHADTDPGKKS